MQGGISLLAASCSQRRSVSAAQPRVPQRSGLGMLMCRADVSWTQGDVVREIHKQGAEGQGGTLAAKKTVLLQSPNQE